MAETTTTTSTAQGHARQAHEPARKTPRARPAARARARSRDRAPTAAKAPSTTTGRRNRTIAANETREAAQANVRAAKTTVKQGRNVAERAALVYVGATLEARDRAVALVSDLRDVTTTRKSAEKQTKLERRGTTARNQLERDVARRAPASSASSAAAAATPSASSVATARRARRRQHGEGARHGDRVSDPTSPVRPAGERRAHGRVRRPHIPPANVAPSPPSTAAVPSGTAVVLNRTNPGRRLRQCTPCPRETRSSRR